MEAAGLKAGRRAAFGGADNAWKKGLLGYSIVYNLVFWLIAWYFMADFMVFHG